MGSPPRMMLRRILRRRSTRSASVLMPNLRERRWLIRRNRRRESSSNEARSAAGTSEKSTFFNRCCALAPYTALPFPPCAPTWLPGWSRNTAEPSYRSWVLLLEDPMCSPEADRGLDRDSRQKVLNNSGNSSHSSLLEQSVDCRANEKVRWFAISMVLAASSAVIVWLVSADNPLLLRKRENSTMEAARRSDWS